MVRHLTETERQISEAAWRAYRENIRLIWATPESKIDEIMRERAEAKSNA